MNAGLRWDYESDMLNNDYVTPDDVRDRDGAVRRRQPLLHGRRRPAAVLRRLAAARRDLVRPDGRRQARALRRLRPLLRSRLLQRRPRREVPAAVRGAHFPLLARRRTAQRPTRRSSGNPSYLSKAGLDGLIASGVAPKPEVFLIDNDTGRRSRINSTSACARASAGSCSRANYAGIRGRNGFTFLFGNRRPDGTCCQPIPGFSNILISSDAKKNWFDALYLTAERPFDGRWGFRVNYTLGQAEAIGGDLFSLDYRTVEDYPRHPASTDERHRVVMTGIVGLPCGFIVSTFMTLASGSGFTIVDNSRGSGIDVRSRSFSTRAGRPVTGDPFNYKSVDLRVEKIFRLPAAAAGVDRVRRIQHLQHDELQVLQRDHLCACPRSIRTSACRRARLTTAAGGCSSGCDTRSRIEERTTAFFAP